MIIRHLTENANVKNTTSDTTTTDTQTKTDFDRTRRLALKMIGGTAVMATGAALSTSAYALGSAASEVEETLAADIVNHHRPGAELTIALSVDPEPTIRITNHSDKLIILRHVHPGIIHAGRKTFDINSMFERSSYAIGAGRSRVVAVPETIATQAERKFPRHLYRNKPQRIVAVTGRNYSGILANSTRSFFA